MRLVNLLLVAALLFLPGRTFAGINDSQKYSPLSIKITVPKKTYAVGEPVDVKIEINNTFGRSFPVVFIVKLYRDGELFGEYRTSFDRVFFGWSQYSLADLGVPVFNEADASQGDWEITIVQQDLDASHAARASWRIVKERRDDET